MTHRALREEPDRVIGHLGGTSHCPALVPLHTGLFGTPFTPGAELASGSAGGGSVRGHSFWKQLLPHTWGAAVAKRDPSSPTPSEG